MARIYGVRLTGYLPRLLQGNAPPPPIQGAAAAMRSFCTYVDQQEGQDCVGEGIVGAHHIVTLGKGKRGSPHGVVDGARARERLRRTDPLQDTGCDPWDAFEAIVSAPCFYPIDGNDFNPGTVNNLETFAEVSGARLFSVDDIHPIESGDLATVDDWHLAGVPVVFWTDVDQAYEEERSGQVWPGITALPILGGHCRVLLPRPPGAAYYEEWGSYGPNWATGGFGRLAPAALERAGFCAISGGPVLS